MLDRILKGLIVRMHRWAIETPRRKFINCGENVSIDAYMQCESDGKNKTSANE